MSSVSYSRSTSAPSNPSPGSLVNRSYSPRTSSMTPARTEGFISRPASLLLSPDPPISSLQALANSSDEIGPAVRCLLKMRWARFPRKAGLESGPYTPCRRTFADSGHRLQARKVVAETRIGSPGITCGIETFICSERRSRQRRGRFLLRPLSTTIVSPGSPCLPGQSSR